MQLLDTNLLNIGALSIVFYTLREKNTMKNKAALILLAFTFLTSCKKDIETNNYIKSNDVFHFYINEDYCEVTDVITAGIIATSFTATGVTEQNTPQLYDNAALTINLINPSVGVFTLGSGATALNKLNVTLPSSSPTTPQTVLHSNFATSQGFVEITEINYSTNRIKGFFETLVAENTGSQDFTISSGEFDIPFVY